MLPPALVFPLWETFVSDMQFKKMPNYPLRRYTINKTLTGINRKVGLVGGKKEHEKEMSGREGSGGSGYQRTGDQAGKNNMFLSLRVSQKRLPLELGGA